MKIIDISLALSEDLVTYQDDEKFKFVRKWNKTTGDFKRNSSIGMNSHSGTHIDAPNNFLRFGSSIDKMDLNNCIGECQVIDLGLVQRKIAYIHLKDKIKSKRILLKTRNAYGKKYDKKFVYLDISAARYLKEMGVTAVGVDYVGLERDVPNHESHKELLKNKISIIEGIDLSKVIQGNYYMIAMTLKVKGGEAAPARVILIQGSLA